MRADLFVAWLGAVVAVTPPGGGMAVAALDNEQFCAAMSETARLGNANAGTWIDRNTRDDGIEVVCRIRTVNYRRFNKSGPTAPDWRERKQREWNSTACSSPLLREAIENGWIITTTITAPGIERVILIANCS
ncbi:MAG TPA: hypothetical protein VFR73_01725 [Hyphomicrobiaceae bacterium]|jgi:hypothetical protein|nr:hypothetical protein [Hyphomicrobiaceae bacterium]